MPGKLAEQGFCSVTLLAERQAMARYQRIIDGINWGGGAKLNKTLRPGVHLRWQGFDMFQLRFLVYAYNRTKETPLIHTSSVCKLSARGVLQALAT